MTAMRDETNRGERADHAAARGASRPLVLVVDDSVDMRGLISDVLTEEGYEVIVASSGGRALSLMAERLPHLVITDLFMPGMNGFTLRGEMLRRPGLAHVPVIVLSAFWQRPSETLDVVDVLPKPLNLDRLLEVVERALAVGSRSDDRPRPAEPGLVEVTEPPQGAEAGTRSADRPASTGAAQRGASRGRKSHAGRIQQEA